MTHELTIQSITPVTHDTYRLVVERPADYAFTPGQATDVALDRAGWRDEARPFTFTSLPSAETLEFVIKSYPAEAEGHSGMTAQIATLEPGERLLLGEPWGAIDDRGAEPHPGVFIAGGAGITPFIGILRARVAAHGSAGGARLFFANARARDIILRDTWDAMPGLDAHYVLSDEAVDGLHHGFVDGALLDAQLDGFDGLFYLCGPPPMQDAVLDTLSKRGVPEDRIVMEA